MEIRVPYGRSTIVANLPDHIPVDIIEPPEIPAAADPVAVVQNAIDNMLGNVDWATFADASSVAIAINDKTRPVPHLHMLPPLLKRLEILGIPDDAITFYVAVGTHPPMLDDEFDLILSESIQERYQIISHDSENKRLLVYLSKTTHGTPVWVNADYFYSDLKIVVGNIEPHQFVGFSGGVKTAAVGLAGLETINHNHALMTYHDLKLGVYELNPARQDVNEIGSKIKIHLALNTVLNQDKQIVQALAGDPVAVLETGIQLSRKNCQVAVPQKYGITISSPGGHPKDINVYQAQKGLAHAAMVTLASGTIILAAACDQGSGSPHYEEWMADKNSYNDVIRSFQQEGFRIGPHKAFQIARDASRFNLITFSELDEKLAQKLLLNPIHNFQTAIDLALANLPPKQHVGILPHASSTIPYLKE